MQTLVSLFQTIACAVLILPVRVYQIAIGPLLPRVCRYEPSCSEYFIAAVEKYGPARGALKGACRICRCHPWGSSGFDPP
jgi:putative membrane protein insertion efficiency factor